MADSDELLKQLMEQTAPDPVQGAIAETVEMHAKNVGTYYRALLREEVPDMLTINLVMTFSGNFWHGIFRKGSDE